MYFRVLRSYCASLRGVTDLGVREKMGFISSSAPSPSLVYLPLSYFGHGG